MMTKYAVTRIGRESIGDSMMRVLAKIPSPFTLIVTVPRMLTVFGSAPTCYEVTEVDILIDDGVAPRKEDGQ